MLLPMIWYIWMKYIARVCMPPSRSHAVLNPQTPRIFSNTTLVFPEADRVTAVLNDFPKISTSTYATQN